MRNRRGRGGSRRRRWPAVTKRRRAALETGRRPTDGAGKRGRGAWWGPRVDGRKLGFKRTLPYPDCPRPPSHNRAKIPGLIRRGTSSSLASPMTDFPPPFPPRAIELRLDPWASDQANVLAVADGESPPAVPVDITVESARWTAIAPLATAGSAARADGPIVFIDGVRRVDRRIIAHAGGIDYFGLLGAYAVGALRAADGPPVVLASRVTRLLVLGGGLDGGPFTVPLSGGGVLTYECATIPETAPEAALTGLQTAMRRAEAEL